ncbi:hypothetical protein SLA2020_335010 [Shorea laevis]
MIHPHSPSSVCGKLLDPRLDQVLKRLDFLCPNFRLDFRYPNLPHALQISPARSCGSPLRRWPLASSALSPY